MIRCASRPNDSTTQPVYMVGLYFNSSMAEVMNEDIVIFYFCLVGINWIFIRSVVVQIYMGQHTRFLYLSPLIYAHADISNKASGLNHGLSLLHPYFVYTCEQQRLWRVCTNQPLPLTDNYGYLMHWPKK